MRLGFLHLSIWDALDVLIVGLLLYQLFRLLRGSIAINIFIGVLLLYGIWGVVDFLQMDALSLLLGQFMNVGMLALLVLFQPEIRRFLLLLGKTMSGRSSWFADIFRRPIIEGESDETIEQIMKALPLLSEKYIGALIVFTSNPNLTVFNASGVRLGAQVSASLLETLFNPEGPLHDGAVVVANRRIWSASCILPVSETNDLPENVGLRHRAAIGITESTESLAVIVSEETGKVSYALDGRLYFDCRLEVIAAVLHQALDRTAAA